MYGSVTVRMAPNNEESVTITFNTGVTQGSITSPQLFNIFINALQCMLTVTGQIENISHGLQIGKNQKGDKQRHDNNYQFSNARSIDDVFIFAEILKGMQTLLNVVKEFTAVWNSNQCEGKRICWE